MEIGRWIEATCAAVELELGCVAQPEVQQVSFVGMLGLRVLHSLQPFIMQSDCSVLGFYGSVRIADIPLQLQLTAPSCLSGQYQSLTEDGRGATRDECAHHRLVESLPLTRRRVHSPVSNVKTTRTRTGNSPDRLTTCLARRAFILTDS